jgi:hypothetical protein
VYAKSHESTWSAQHQPFRELGEVEGRVRTRLVAAPAAEVGGAMSSFTSVAGGLIYNLRATSMK